MMDELQLQNPKEPGERGRRSRVFLIVVAIAVVFLGWLLVTEGGLFFYPGSEAGRRQARRSVEQHLPFGAGERAYAPNVHIEKISMSRAENFLHQEVTNLAGDLVNGGDRSLQGLEITIEFSDEFHQLVLRETRILFSGSAPALSPGGHREFEVSFEHIPSLWNRQQPGVSVTGLQFATAK